MTQSTIEQQQGFHVHDVVDALIGPENPGSPADLREQMERAAAEFDSRTADTFGKLVLDSLTEDPANLRYLEALLVVGLAHPEILRRHRISLAVEGRRLAVLMERSGQVDRARGLLELLAGHLPEERTIDHELAGILRRSGNTEELLDRYLERAEHCVAEGKISEAIPWLQEILLLDRSRRDVARMIRDLRYQEAERSQQRSRRSRLLLLLILFSACMTALFSRERDVRSEYAELPAAVEADVQTLRERRAAIEEFIDGKVLWSGLLGARAEVSDLGDQIEELELAEERRSREAELERERLGVLAEDARLRAIMNFEAGSYEKALLDFRRAYSLASADWPHRAQVEREIEALQAWKEEQQ